VIRLDAPGFQDIHESVERRMDECATGIELEIQLHDLETFAEMLEEFVGMPLPGEGLAEGILALEDGGRSAESAGRQLRGRDSVPRCQSHAERA
jgi:hypothetical protein